MIFSMAATDRYPAMHHSWGNWPPLHMQGSYMPQRWQNGLHNSGLYGGPAMSVPDYNTEKPPLTQLQELTQVFPSANESYLPHQSEPILPYNHVMSNYHKERECDSGYADINRGDKCEQDGGYASDRLSLDEGPYSVEPAVPRECDSGFGPTFHAKEEPDSLDLCADCDSGCARDAHAHEQATQQLDLAPSARDALADSDSGCADITCKWEDCSPPSALPGFQQAFGSTEIGRFSRNDFFTNPSPPKSNEPTCEPPRKATRKPRTPRVKQARKERAESPRPRLESRRDLPNVPLPEMQCHGRGCGPYEPCTSRYCPDYPPASYPYNRVPTHPPYPNYPSCEMPSPYIRPFPFPMSCGQPWSEPRWSPYHHQQQQQHPYQQSWTSANVYPFMRLDY